MSPQMPGHHRTHVRWGPSEFEPIFAAWLFAKRRVFVPAPTFMRTMRLATVPAWEADRCTGTRARYLVPKLEVHLAFAEARRK